MKAKCYYRENVVLSLKYLAQKKQEKDIYALTYAFGHDEADKICKEALDLNKKED